MSGGMPMRLLPPQEGACPECATPHPIEHPHNRDSLYYQVAFQQEHGRRPTWTDAIAHCDEEMKAAWWDELRAFGIEAGP